MTAEDLALEARIQRLEDTENIRTLKSRYHTYVNDTDFDRIGSLFASDASLKLGYLMPGLRLYRKWMANALSKPKRPSVPLVRA